MISNAKPNPDQPDRPGTSADAFLGGRLEIVQRTGGHRGGSDAVFLAAAVPAQTGEAVLDAGAGAGTAGLCVLARVSGVTLTAVEIDANQCDLAVKNAARNGLASHFRAVTADLSAPARALSEAGLIREGYDHVMANPPFYAAGSVRATPDTARATAHVMPNGELERWVRFLTTHTAPRGTITLIHRADCLGVLFDLLQDRFGDLAVYPLFPKEGVPASRVIIHGRKNSRAKVRLLQGLVLHEVGGSYTEEAEAVLRGGAGLFLGTSKNAGVVSQD